MEKLWIGLGIFFSLVMGILAFDKEEIQLESFQEKVKVEYDSKYKAPDVKAYKVHTLIPFWKSEVKVSSTGSVDTKTLGNYPIVYRAGSVKKTQTVIVQDSKKPKLEFVNDPTYQKMVTAIDNYDGDITADIQIELKGKNVLYSVTDSSGNKASLKRKVNIPNKKKKASKESSKTIYLTFDDGPSEYTDHLLDILDQYNVSATFFTTSAQPNKAECMKRAHEKGHTVAVHTQTHDYSDIYSSEKAYWADYDKQNEAIKEMTGQSSTIFRFPGGSSNTISQKYSNGIMTRLVKQAKKRKLQFFDWNVSSGDAGEVTTSEAVFYNVILGIQAAHNVDEPSVVLQHDTHAYSVDAVERIILWGLDNGYEFQALQLDSFAPHHPISN